MAKRPRASNPAVGRNDSRRQAVSLFGWKGRFPAQAWNRPDTRTESGQSLPQATAQRREAGLRASRPGVNLEFSPGQTWQRNARTNP